MATSAATLNSGVQGVAEPQDKQVSGPQVTANEPLEQLATKVADIGGRYKTFAADEATYTQKSHALIAQVEDLNTKIDALDAKWIKKKKSFTDYFSENAKVMMEFRSEFPSVKNPGSKEPLHVLGRDWLLSEFVTDKFGITIQAFNQAMKAFAKIDIEKLDEDQLIARQKLDEEKQRNPNKGGGSKPKGESHFQADTAKGKRKPKPLVPGNPANAQVQVINIDDPVPVVMVNHQSVVAFLKKEAGESVLVLRQKLEGLIRDIDFARGKLTIIMNT